MSGEYPFDQQDYAANTHFSSDLSAGQDAARSVVVGDEFGVRIPLAV